MEHFHVLVFRLPSELKLKYPCKQQELVSRQRDIAMYLAEMVHENVLSKDR